MSLSRFLMVRLGRALTYPTRRALRRFEADCFHPERTQARVLREILAAQRNTAFGKDHHFRNLATAAEFRKNVPVAPYEYVAPYIDRVKAGETSALLSDPRVLMFALTSGTTAARKMIPITPEYMRCYRRGWQMWGVKMYRDHRGRKIALRPMVQMVGDPDEFRTETGVPCGNLTGFTAKIQMRLVRRLYAVPHETGKIKDPRAKLYVALRFSIARNVSQFMAANPSTLTQFARALDAEKAALLKDLHDGTLRTDIDIPQGVREILAPRLKPEPAKARELGRVAEAKGRLFPRDVWDPAGTIVCTWTGGSMGPYLRQLPQYYGDTPVRDLGLLASEGRMTIPFTNSTPAGVLDIGSHYYEFIPEGEIDSPNPTVLAAHEMQLGGHYYLCPTTRYGLYRYHISDVVRVTGFFGNTPEVEFLGKGSRFSNITGEKLTEHHVTRAVDAVLQRIPQPLTGYTLAPVWDETAPYYSLVLEAPDAADGNRLAAFVADLDAELGRRNDEYAAKRASGRLGAVRSITVPAGFWHRWDRDRLAKTGGSSEQYKRPCLMPDVEFAAGLPN